jgi:serine phosphatase RsbU (regulator of sigma subunit)
MLRSLTSRVPFHVALPGLISLLVLGSISSLIYVFYRHARIAVRDLAGQNLIQVHERISDRLNDYFNVAERINRINRETIRMGHWDRHDLASWRGALFEQVSGFETVSSVLWGDIFGGAVFVSRYPGEAGYRFGLRMPAQDAHAAEYRLSRDGHPAPQPSARYEYDPRVRPWYLAALAAQGPAWAGIYAWVPKAGMAPVLAVPYVAPVYGSHGEMLGVFDVEFSLHDISGFLATLSVGRRGMAFIMDQDGLLVAASGGAPLVDAATGARVAAHASTDPLIAAAASRVAARSGPGTRLVTRAGEMLEINGGTHLVMAAPFSRSGELRWLAVTVMPAEDFLASVWAGRRQGFVVGAVTLMTALILGVLLAAYVSRPIRRLSEHVRAVGAGDLDAEIRIDEFPEFARLSGAINAMVGGLRERLRLRQSLELAKEVQQRLLPARTPQFFGLEIAAYSDYCEETGGDYIDYLQLRGQSPDTAVVAIGDVSGHGVAAAMIMASARALLRSRGRDTGSLADLLGHMNRQITEDAGGGRFMTMLLLAVDARRRSLRWACAGHREPLLLEAAATAFTELDGAGIPLGVDVDAEYQEYRFDDLRAGQILVLATDGLWEARDPAGQKLGLDRLFTVIHDCRQISAADIRDRVAAAEQEFRGGRPQGDDISFVIIKVTATTGDS